jgi:hypothetical protein
MFLTLAEAPSAWESFFNWLSRFDNVVGLFGAAFAIWGWVRTSELLAENREARRRRESPVTIRLRTSRAAAGGSPPAWDEIALPYRPRRDQLSRAELLGILGVYGGKDRFDSRLLLPLLESGRFDAVLAGDDSSESDDTLVIDCPPDVFQWFQSCITNRSC